MNTQPKTLEQLQAENRRMTAVLHDIRNNSNCAKSAELADRVLGAIGDAEEEKGSAAAAILLAAIAGGVATFVFLSTIGSW